jgi:photosystem II stability/assembly factor-like uncharacterized protein
LTSAGVGIALGEGFLARTTDGGERWEEEAPIPELSTYPAFGYAYLNGIECHGTTFVGGGYWVGVHSVDDGLTWQASEVLSAGFPAQVMDIARSPLTGTMLSVGYYALARSIDDGITFSELATSTTVQGWLHDVVVTAEGTFVAVGDGGQIVRSDDDGLTFAAIPAPPGTSDLYTLQVGPESTLAAAGMHGSVIVSIDDGLSWEGHHTGRDAFVGALWFNDDGALTALGRAGTVLSFRP